MAVVLDQYVAGGGQFTPDGEKAFAQEWGAWRFPFACSGLLLAVSVWIRVKLSESPAFLKIKAEGKVSKAPLKESFGEWKNLNLKLPNGTQKILKVKVVKDVCWYSVTEQRQIQVVLVRDPEKKWRDERLMSTDVRLSDLVRLSGH